MNPPRGESNRGSLRAAMVAASVLATAVGCHAQPDGGARSEAAAVAVETAPARLAELADLYEAAGTVRARVSAALAAKVMAVVEEVRVEAGAKVSAGDVLARLDDRDLRAEYDRAKADYERTRTLLAKEATTRAEYDAALSRYRVAEAALSYAVIAAPFDGVVADKFVDAGDMATPGRTLFTIERPDAYQLEANVPERLRGLVSLRMRVDVEIEAIGQPCTGSIGELVPAADPGSRTFRIKVDLDCPRPPQSGAFGRVEIPVGVREGIAVPMAAIRKRGQLVFVHVVADGRAHMRLVRTGSSRNGTVEVVAGLEGGERVITSAAGDVVDGTIVEEAGAQAAPVPRN